MKINEIISEDISRRGLLKGLGAAAAVGLGADAMLTDKEFLKNIYINYDTHLPHFSDHTTKYLRGELNMSNLNEFPVSHIVLKFEGKDKNGDVIDSTTREYKPTLHPHESISLNGFDFGMFAAGTQSIYGYVKAASKR